MSRDPVIDLPAGVFLILRDLIRDRLGMWFEDEKRELLASKLVDRVQAVGCPTFLDYFYLLKYDPGREGEWDALTDALSVQETYFWREFEQIRVLLDILLPQRIAASKAPVRIWCAACATGEEPLTIAMAIQEAGWFEKADIQIFASDASLAALKKANLGIYRARAFRTLPLELRDKYFTPNEDGWLIKPEISSRVTFRQANLLDPAEIAPLAAADFVFCRNVFIYFSIAAITRVVGQFAEHTPRPAHLFVGVSESLLRITSPFQLEEIGGSFVYVKR